MIFLLVSTTNKNVLAIKFLSDIIFVVLLLEYYLKEQMLLEHSLLFSFDAVPRPPTKIIAFNE
jgi:hypothetical protein